MLTQTSAISYLMERGLVAPPMIVDGELAVWEAPHRNANFQITAEPGASYMLKQAVSADAQRTLRHEAEVYVFLHSEPAAEPVRRCLPRLYLYDPDDHVLVLELFADGRDLRWYHIRLGRFPPRPAVETGEFLAALHCLPMLDEKGGFSAPVSDSLPPYSLFVHRPRLAGYNELSGANRRLTQIIQQYPEFCRLLDDLGSDWRQECFVHGDMKWANLILASNGKSRRKELKVVDWELGGVGDPCWDAGSVFNDYLSFWLLSIPISGEDPPERFLELARFPLARMQPAIRSFWDAYTEGMGLDAGESHRWLVRAVRYAAARLVQTAFENSQDVAEPAGNFISFLQVALNVLQRPEDAAVYLLGIPWQKVWAI